MVKLEVGKFYRTRDGRKVGPMKHYGKVGLLKQYGMGDLFFECDDNLWFNDGGFEWDRESKNDLVAEWVDNDHIERTKRMIEVMQAYVDGSQIELSSKGSEWFTSHHGPEWNWFDTEYRIAKIPDNINWDHVAPEFKYMARDEDGNVGLYTDRPEACNGQWFPSEGKYAEAGSYSSYKKGTVDWQDSLVTRPGSE